MLDALPAVTLPSRLEDGAQRRESFQRGVAARSLVLRDHNRVASALRNAHFRNLPAEASAFDGGNSALVANQCKLVLILAADLEALCYILGSYAHVVAVDWTAESLDQAVAHSGITHSEAVEARLIAEHERGLAHVFRAARYCDVHLACADKLRRHVNGFKS